MSSLKIEQFGGMVPQLAQRKLAPNQAYRVQNAQLWSEELQPIRKRLSVEVPTKAGTKASLYLLDDLWLHWTQDVDVVLTPKAGVSDRIHYTGHYNPKSTDPDLAANGGTDYPEQWYRLGLPAPDTAPSVSHTGGSGADETRSYVYTYVTAWGEEGPPSPATEYTGKEDASSFDLSSMDTAPPNSYTISSISLNTSTGVLTFTCSAAHKLETGEYVTIAGVTHYTELNDTHQVTRVSSTEFSIETSLVTLELVTNGDFALATGWTQGTGWSIGSGVASASAGSASTLHRTDGGITSSIKYLHAFTISNYSAGSIQALVGSTGLGTARSANGTFSETITAAGTDQVGVSKDSSFVGDVDDVSVQEAPDDWSVGREAPIQTDAMTKRIYRTDANGIFRFVAEIAVATTSYADSIANIALGEEIPSTLWDAPPGDLIGIVALPNGGLAGFVGNVVYFSEPRIPHAWPSDYTHTTDYPIVGLSVWGGEVAVLTTGTPYVISGVHPANMSMRRFNYLQSCTSKRGIRSLESGVIYPSPNGLVMVNNSGAALITERLMERKDWQLYNPDELIGAIYDDRYYGFYMNGGENGDESGAFVFDPKEPLAEFTLIGQVASAVYHHLEQDALYVIDDGIIYRYDAGGAFAQVFWRSGIIRLKQPVTMTVARVRLTTLAGITEDERIASIVSCFDTITNRKASLYLVTDGTFNGAEVNLYDVNGGPYADCVAEFDVPGSAATFKLYTYDEAGDRTLRHSESVTSGQPFRMPGGYQADEIEIELSALNIAIHDIAVAETPGELAGL